VPQATNEEMQWAIDAASEAFKTWSQVSGVCVCVRARVCENFSPKRIHSLAHSPTHFFVYGQ
jgi:hypothetical protein